MKFFRSQRISSLIREKLSWLIIKEVEVESALITLTNVEVKKDLSRAMVRFSVLPSDKAPQVLKILGKQASRLQFMLSREINIRPMPRLVFEIDRGLERAAEVEKALLKDK
jgi:ribosome-binding factor A